MKAVRLMVMALIFSVCVDARGAMIHGQAKRIFCLWMAIPVRSRRAMGMLANRVIGQWVSAST